MPRLTLLLVLFTIADITVSQALAHNLAKNVIEHLKLQQQLKDKYQEERDDDDDDNVRSLNAQDLESLLEVALKTGGKYGAQKSPGRKEKNRNKNHNLQATLFDQLTGLGENDILVYDADRLQSIHTEHQKDPLWDMLGSSSYNRDINDEVDDNPEKPLLLVVEGDNFQNSKGDRIINDLVSLLSSANQKDRSDGRQDHRYKGFRLRNSYRRARGSSEMSSREIEEKRPITRPRAYGGGRTPIPYIKHRGDIYERDN